MTTTDSATDGQASPTADPLLPHDAAAAQVGEPPRTRRSRGSIIAIAILGVALVATLAYLAINLVSLDDANSRLKEQQRQLDEQRDLIEKKETFGAAMQSLMGVAAEFDGVLLSSLVPLDRYQSVASQAWHHRWDSNRLDRDIQEIRNETKALDELRAAAATQAAINSTGTEYEAVIDQLGGGFVTSLLDDADARCNADVLACVSSADPRTIHFDAAGSAEPYMTDWLRTGVAYHEFAHVLQMMNPLPTETALASFAGDDETMADCFALTFLDGWTLEHRIWINRYDYWDIDIGYGHDCDGAQQQAIRDWYGKLGFRWETIRQ